MLSPYEFVTSWKASELVRYSANAVQTLNISQSSKCFLVEAGLPRQYFSAPVSYQALRDLPVLGDTFADTFPFPADIAHFRVLSVTKGASRVDRNVIAGFYCLNEHSHGQVIEVYTNGTGSMESGFLNSSIPQFAEFLLVYNDYETWVDERREEREKWARPFTSSQWKVKSQEVHHKLHEIDPEAFRTPDQKRASMWDEVLYGFESNVDWSP